MENSHSGGMITLVGMATAVKELLSGMGLAYTMGGMSITSMNPCSVIHLINSVSGSSLGMGGMTECGVNISITN